MRLLIPLSLAISALAYSIAPAFAQPGQALPHTIVYKTDADIKELVAVQLSADGSKLTYYPAPTDMAGQPPPVRLGNGYWIASAGVSERIAFLGMTKKEYSALKEPPTQVEMMHMIKVRNPMTELWDCGVRDKLSDKQLKKLARKKRLATKCRRMK
ncbi:hypothetical protein GCM10023093_31340 [Nemorincola caseinilytica]|uniref:Uncharacterized protein n=1 Tax=Nemorincola caseinilytica TaxID=2054315 RepID=A0ABP8NPJ4_9BACT